LIYSKQLIILVKISLDIKEENILSKKEDHIYLFWSKFLLKEEKYYSYQKHNFTTQSRKIKTKKTE
jgi:hypothetical protein